MGGVVEVAAVVKVGLVEVQRRRDPTRLDNLSKGREMS